MPLVDVPKYQALAKKVYVGTNKLISYKAGLPLEVEINLSEVAF